MFAEGILAVHDTLSESLKDVQEAADALLGLDPENVCTTTLNALLARVGVLNSRSCHLLHKAVRLTEEGSTQRERAVRSYQGQPAVVPETYAEFNDGQLMKILEGLGLATEPDSFNWTSQQLKILKEVDTPVSTSELVQAVANRARRNGLPFEAEQLVYFYRLGRFDWADEVSAALAG